MGIGDWGFGMFYKNFQYLQNLYILLNLYMIYLDFHYFFVHLMEIFEKSHFLFLLSDLYFLLFDFFIFYKLILIEHLIMLC